MKKVKNLIVGCGLSGVVMAERLANQLSEEVFMIDSRDHIAGNCYDYKDKNNITIQAYGPHAFHTQSKQVWDYLSTFTRWHYFMYRVRAVIDGIEVNIPFNLDSLHKVFPSHLADKLSTKLIENFGFNIKVPILKLKNTNDKDLKFLADYIYEKVFLGYSLKQWGVKLEDLDPSVGERVPVFISKDDRYFQDTYQAIPLNGYTKMIENIIDNPLIKVQLNTKFKDIQDKIEYERLFYTGSIDDFFDYKFGLLPYRSLNLDFVEYNQEYFQSSAQINYPSNYDFTRITEYKYYLNEKSEKTLVSFEYPTNYEREKNERYYPIPNSENQSLYDKYLKEAQKMNNTYFFGRLGAYKYYNMDEIVLQALQLFEKIKG